MSDKSAMRSLIIDQDNVSRQVGVLCQLGGTSSIIPPVVLSVATLVSNVVTSVKNAQDVAKNYGDSELKSAISDLYNDVLNVKERVLELDDENCALRAELAKKGSVTYAAEFGYCFVAGDSNPYCPTCYEASEKLLHLTASEPWNGGVRRNCRRCRHTYWEKPMTMVHCA